MVAIFSSVMDEKKGRGHSLKPSATLQDRGEKLTNAQRMHSLEAFTAFASFQNRLQAAAIYKKRNKKGKPKVILTDDTLHRTIFIWPKSSSPLLRFYDTSIS